MCKVPCELLFLLKFVCGDILQCYSLSVSGKVPDDDIQLSALKLKPNMKIMMMGTPEEVLVRKQIRSKCIISMIMMILVNHSSSVIKQ